VGGFYAWYNKIIKSVDNMKNETKLKKVKRWLDENNIRWKARNHHRNGHSDCFVIDTKVSIKIEGADDEVFYRRHKRGYHPVFIRKTDTPKFVIEKVANTIRDAMLKQQDYYLKQQRRKEALKNEQRQR
jgi:hypothetical protein